MEESKKKTIMVVIIAVCLVGAGIFTFMNRSDKGGVPQVLSKKTVWLFCTDSGCEHAYQTDMKTYFEEVDAKTDPATLEATPFTCPKCNKETIKRAEKCPECELIFVRFSVPNALADTCPECGYSKQQEKRDKVKAKRRGEGG